MREIVEAELLIGCFVESFFTQLVWFDTAEVWFVYVSTVPFDRLRGIVAMLEGRVVPQMLRQSLIPLVS